MARSGLTDGRHRHDDLDSGWIRGAHKWAAQGRTFIDANRVESVEELIDASQGNTTVITLQSGCDHRVMETPDQIGALMTLVCNPLIASAVETMR